MLLQRPKDLIPLQSLRCLIRQTLNKPNRQLLRLGQLMLRPTVCLTIALQLRRTSVEISPRPQTKQTVFRLKGDKIHTNRSTRTLHIKRPPRKLQWHCLRRGNPPLMLRRRICKRRQTRPREDRIHHSKTRAQLRT